MAFAADRIEYDEPHVAHYQYCSADWWKQDNDEKIRYVETQVLVQPRQITPTLEREFNELAKEWRNQTGGASLTMRRYAHPSYQSILAMEPKKAVIKLILSELRERPDRWFEALKVLTKANPASDSKSFEETVQKWIDWGVKEKYIS